MIEDLKPNEKPFRILWRCGFLATGLTGRHERSPKFSPAACLRSRQQIADGQYEQYG